MTKKFEVILSVSTYVLYQSQSQFTAQGQSYTRNPDEILNLTLSQMSSFSTLECKYLIKMFSKDAMEISIRLWWQNDILAFKFMFW